MRKRKNFTKKEIGILNKYYPENGSLFCSQLLPDRSLTAVNAKANLLGLKIISKEKRDSLRREGQNKPSDHYNINPEQFYNISTSEVAYFLGYFWADGHLAIRKVKGGHKYTFSLGISYIDYISIKEIIDKLGKWSVSIREPNVKQKRPSKIAVISTGNMPLVKYLFDLDFQEKSQNSPTKILSKIPNHLKHYFWLGYFDGDGSIVKGSSYVMAFTGAYSQDWTDTENLCKELGISYSIQKRISKMGKNSSFRILNRQNVHIMGSYLYSSIKVDKIGLLRKYSKWAVAEEIFKKSEKIRNTKIEEDENFIKNEENFLFIIKKYSGEITRQKILEHFSINQSFFWKLKFSLEHKGFIYSDKTVGEKPYFSKEPNDRT